MNITDSLIGCVLQKLDESEEKYYQPIRDCFLDYIGVLLTGASVLSGRHEKYIQVSKPWGSCTAVGIASPVDPYTAALLNGLSAHVLELDDGHRYGMLHPGVTNFSALLTVVQTQNISPALFFRAAVAGYEMTIRLATMVQPEHKKRGFHASATCGTVGAAFAIGIARGYSREELKNTVSAAVTSASGLLEMIDDDSELKPYNCAQAAVNGILAANNAFAGYKGPIDALGGRRGFIRSMSGEINEDKVKLALGMRDCVSRVYRKMYASCRHTHSAVEAALNVRAKMGGDNIDSIKVETYDLAVFGHDHVKPNSISAAKMSTPYSVATALLYGKAGPDAFTPELLNDEKVLDLASRVSVSADDELSKLVPEVRAARINVKYKDGTVCTEQVDYPKGEPENPLSMEEMKQKFFKLLAITGRTDQEICELYQAIKSLNHSWDIFISLI